MRRVALALAALILAVAGARGDEPLRIRIAWTVVPRQMTPLLFARTELLHHLGQSYVVEHLHFSATAPMVTALAAGEVDLASLTPVSFGAAIQNAGLDDLRVVADGYQDGVGRDYSSEFMVRSDAAIREIEDLRGKVLAVNTLGGGGDFALRRMLRRHGLDDRRDARIVEVRFPEMPALLETGKVDLVAPVAPFAQLLSARGTARSLFTRRDAVGPWQSLMLVARAGFLAENRAALDDFFEDYLRALRWFLDPAHRDEAVRLAAQFNRDKVAVLADYLFTAGDYFRDRDGRPNLDALQHDMRLLHDEGALAIDIDVRDFADLDFVAAAARRLE